MWISDRRWGHDTYVRIKVVRIKVVRIKIVSLPVLRSRVKWFAWKCLLGDCENVLVGWWHSSCLLGRAASTGGTTFLQFCGFKP